MNNNTPTDESGDPAIDTDSPVDAMNEQMRNDVASWRAARSEPVAREAAPASVPTVRAPVPKPAPRAKQTKPAGAPTEAAAIKKKPFGMSYDGMTQADYITYMISRGAR
jgi:hypothetical protein